jgi:amino acid adenylation domain-containing protein
MTTATKIELEADQLIVVPAEAGDIDLRQSIPARFEQQVRLYPQRLAIKYQDRSITYAELNASANRMAQAIVARRGEGEEPIGLLIDDRLAAITALFAVLKAGKIVVILDPVYPAARLEQIMQDAQLALIVTDRSALALAQQLVGAERSIVNVDALDADLSDQNLNLDLSPERLADILYTSGSTGQPKGVMRTHQRLMRTVKQQMDRYTITANDRALQMASLGFSGSLSSVYGMLCNGGAVVPYDLQSGGLIGLKHLLREAEITIFSATSTVFRHLVATFDAHDRFPSVRQIGLGGEPVLRKDIELCRQHFEPGCSVRTTLASTECGSISEYYIKRDTLITMAVMPVGYVLADTEVMIMDEAGHEVVPGEVGEIWVKSRYLASGYWRRPDLTAATFLLDPDGSDQRIFRTGDLGRMQPDGLLEHLGRKDFQVKIRGNRVETAEIEMALLDHAAVEEACVIARDDQSGEKVLAAYLVAQSRSTIGSSELRTYLKTRLPDYMIPSAFVWLAALPLNANGKIDRAALPEPDRTANRSDSALTPRDELEATLAKIWQDTLRLNTIDLSADFFELGGDSLLAARIFAEIDRQLGKRLSPTVLLTSPTIEQLASIVRQSNVSAPPPTLVALQPLGSKPPLFLAHGIGGGVLDYTPLARQLGSDQPVYGLVAVGLDGTEPQVVDLREMAMRYVQEILTKQPDGPYAIGGYSYGGAVAFEIAQQLLALGQEVKVLAEFDSPAPRSNFQRVRLNKQFMVGFVQNFPFWLEQLLRLGPRGILASARRKLRPVWRRRKLNQGDIDISDLIDDVSHISPEQREFMENQSRGLRVYQPQPYAGRIVAFRARRQSLFCSFDPNLGWDTLAAEVESRVVAGSHHNLLQAPYVQSLAEQLKECLD